MISFDQLSGNETLKSDLKNAFSTRFSQTTLLSGDDKEGLSSFANVIAAGLLCETAGQKPCGTCLSCRKVESGIHPDFMLIDFGETELKVDLARRIKAENMMIPNDGANRVTVIHHAHQLNISAQNVLLKELEEPPKHAFFILTTERPDVLLETVRSRCTKFTLEPSKKQADETQIAQILQPYLSAIAEGREEKMMLAAVTLEKIPNKELLPMLQTMKAAFRDAVFAANALDENKLIAPLEKTTAQMAKIISSDRLLKASAFLDELSDRVRRNAASAATTCALTSDIYRICFL